MLFAAPLASAAQGTATLRGLVYSCEDGRRPVAGARVSLRRLDGGTAIWLTSDAHGRFVRVGLSPGRYMVTARTDRREWLGITAASRMAMLESDDVLDMTLGIKVLPVIGMDFSFHPDPNQPHPICDPPLVPPAPSTTDRYIIH